MTYSLSPIELSSHYSASATLQWQKGLIGMPKTRVNKVRGPAFGDAEEEIVRYTSLQDLLQPGQTLVLNTRLGTLSQLTNQDDTPTMLMEQQFSTSELSALMLLIASYPNYASYEVLYVSINNGRINDKAIENARLRLAEAQHIGTWEGEMKQVRNTLSRIRIKMRAFDIDISSIITTGYMLKRCRHFQGS